MAVDLLPSVENRARDTIATLFEYVASQGQRPYGGTGERVSQLEHSLQCAALAKKAGADEETVLAALLHDIGHFLPQYKDVPMLITPAGLRVGRQSHDKFGEAYLRQLGFSDKVSAVVGGHVMAKRYLTAVNPEYYDGLSPVSKTSLKYQGGPMTADEVKAHAKEPYLQDKLDVRVWDDLAKDPDAVVEGLSAYESMAVKSLLSSWQTVSLHGRTYHLPTEPVVVVCVDGFDPEYLEQGLADGILPNLASIIQGGFHQTAECAMPSFTNPNNVSIITGAPTQAHGIAGNFYLDRETREEHMVVDDTLLRGDTLLQLLARRGVRVAAITAKDKLRRILRHGLFDAGQSSGSICFSAEKAGSCTMEEHGIADVEDWVGRPAPSQYSGDLSLYVLEAGVKLLQERRADVLYLTLSDYVQHKHAPGSKESNDFLASLDARIGELARLASVVGVTGDHGMSNKSQSGGDQLPNVLFLQDELETKFGEGAARVICPITDPFVRHHGALGGFVRVYARSPDLIKAMMEMCGGGTWAQIELVLSGTEAAERFEMPLDREADFVVVAASDAVIGSKKGEHDLAALRGHPLRSHGGLSEQKIPLIVSRPCQRALSSPRPGPWRNFDVFDLVLNGAREL